MYTIYPPVGSHVLTGSLYVWDRTVPLWANKRDSYNERYRVIASETTITQKKKQSGTLKPQPSNTDATKQMRAARQQQETRPRGGVSIATKDHEGPELSECSRDNGPEKQSC